MKRKMVVVPLMGALVTSVALTGTAAANPDNSGSRPSAENLSYRSGPQSQAHWLGSVQAGSELGVGYALAGPYNAGTPYGGGYAKIVLHHFPATLPSEEPTFQFSGDNVAGELRWYIEFTGGLCHITAAQQDATPLSPAYLNPPCYAFGYPSPPGEGVSGGAPFTWETHYLGNVNFYADWAGVRSVFGNQPVNDVRVVADNSGANAPFTDIVTNVQYGGDFPTP